MYKPSGSKITKFRILALQQDITYNKKIISMYTKNIIDRMQHELFNWLGDLMELWLWLMDKR